MFLSEVEAAGFTVYEHESPSFLKTKLRRCVGLLLECEFYLAVRFFCLFSVVRVLLTCFFVGSGRLLNLSLIS